MIKKTSGVLLGLIVISFVVISFYFYQNKQKKSDCFIDITYVAHDYGFGGGEAYYSREEGLINSRRFKTHQEGMEYCMSVKR